MAEIVARCQPDPRLRPFTVVLWNGEPFPRPYWRTAPKLGQHLQVATVPQGGSGLLRAVLTVAVIAAAGFATVATGGTAGLLLGAAITVGGTLAINALVPPPQPKLGAKTASDEPTFTLEGARNRPRLFAPFPRVLGTHKFVPDLLAKSYTELDGDDTYLRCLFSFGYGPLSITDERIGDTPLDDFDNVDKEFFPGDEGVVIDSEIYSNQVSREPFSVQLDVKGTWVSRTTRPDTDRALVELTLPQGGQQFGSQSGDRLGVTFEIELQYRLTGTSTWKPSTPEGLQIKVKTATEVRRSKTLTLDTDPGEFEIRVRVADTDLDDDEAERVPIFLSAITSVRFGKPCRLPGISATALRIKASEQLSGELDEYSAVARSIGPEYDEDADSWITRATRRPDALFRLVLQGQGARERLPDDDLDLTGLRDWARWNRDQNNFCDLVITNETSRWDVLRMVAAAGRASPTVVNGRYGVVVDRPKSVSGLYTPLNMAQGGLKTTNLFPELPHALRCRFVNRDQDYAQDEIFVYADGFDEDNATRFEEFEFPGITSPERIYRFGRYRLAEAKLRPERLEWSSDWEQIAHQRGDVVAVASDSILVGSGQARVASRTISGGLLASLALTQPVEMEAGQSYAARSRSASGAIRFFRVQTIPGSTTVLTPTEDVPTSAAPGQGDLVLVGVPGRTFVEVLLTEIRPSRDFGATMVGLPYDPAVYTADTEDIPEYRPRITLPPGSEVPIVSGVRSDQLALARDSDGSAHLQLIVSLSDDGSRPLTRVAGVVVRCRPADTGARYRFLRGPGEALELVLAGVEAGTEYELAARYDFRDGTQGRWSSSVRHIAVGADMPPPDVAAIFLAGDAVAWSSVVAPDLAGYRVRYSVAKGQGWDEAPAVTDGLLTSPEIPLAAIPTDAAEVLVKAETTAEVQSANPARLSVRGVPRPRSVEVFLFDAGAGAYAGEIVGAEVVGGVLRALDTSIWGAPPGAIWGDPPGAVWGNPSWSSFSWNFRFTVPAEARQSDRVRLAMTFTGEVYTRFRSASNTLLRYQADEDLPSGGTPLPPGWVPIGAAILGGGSNPYVGWKEGLRAEPGDVLEFQILGRGGTPVRPSVTSFRLAIEAPEVREQLADVAIPPGGAILPIRNAYRGIEYIGGTFDAGSTAITLKRSGRSPTIPLVVALDASDQFVAGRADILVIGY